MSASFDGLAFSLLSLFTFATSSILWSTLASDCLGAGWSRESPENVVIH